MQKLLVALLSSALLTTCMSAQQFFPIGALSINRKMDEIRSDWYSEELNVLHEPSIWQGSHRSHDTIYRFLWLRAFHPPLCVRLDIGSRTASITSKEGRYHGAGEPGKLLQTKTSRVPQRQVDKYLRDVAENHFWTIPSPNGDLGGPDGSEWILEAADHGTYKVLVAYIASGNNPVRVLGFELLFDIAHIRVPANSIY
jgi:hypothetical protein